MHTAEHTRSDISRRELLELIPGLELIAVRALGNVDDARDVVQEVLARAIATVEGGGGRRITGTLAAFVHGIAVHVIADLHRARARTIPSSPVIDAARGSEANTLDSLIDDEERSAVAAAVARLDPSDRELLHRCFVDGQQVAVIARATGEPAARIRKRKSRALQRIRDLLRENPRGHVSQLPATKKT